MSPFTSNKGKRGLRTLGLLSAGLSFLLSACSGISADSEDQSRAALDSVTQVYRPTDGKKASFSLSAKPTLAELLTYAMLNQPRVEAAYYDWAASVERITGERSLPDPLLTYQMDIQSIVTSIMPGLMMNFPGPGKLTAKADIASAESEAKYFAFESAVLQAAYNVKKSYINLHYLDEKIRLNREMLGLVNSVEAIARVQNEAGKVTLQDVLRAQIEAERLKNEISNFEDARNPLLAQFKASLGLPPHSPNPSLPDSFETTPLSLSSDELLQTALACSPKIKALEAEVKVAEAGIRLANKGDIPDFSVGLEGDVRTAPVLWRPTATMTLPIWRDKIAADIAAAEHRKHAAEAQLSAEQIQLAVEVADKTYLYREATRNLVLLKQTLLPTARLSLEVARTSYSVGKVEFINLIEAERTLLEFQLATVEASAQRELAVTELSLLIAGVPPAGAPILSADKKTEPNATVTADD